MTVEEKALDFAIKVHKGQKRKSDEDIPMFFHSLNVGQILKEYGFDENFVAAGFLHDAVDNTKYTLKDIEKEFGKDIASLVTNKALICADKISDLEDLLLYFSRKGKCDFSKIKFENKQRYYTNVLESLKVGEMDDQLKPMLKRYDDLLQKVFYNGDIDIEIRNNYFNSDVERYNQIKRLHHKKEELLKLKSLTNKPESYLIELDGVKSTEIKRILNDLNQFSDSDQYKITLLDESNIRNFKNDNNDLIIVDEVLFSKKYYSYNNILIPLIKENTFFIVKTDNHKSSLEDFSIKTANVMLDNVRSDYILKLKKEYRSE